MDGAHFDAFARSCVTSSRRSIVTTVATALLAALLGADAPEALLAKQGRKTSSHGGRDKPARVAAGKKKKKKKKKRTADPGLTAPPPSCIPESAAQTCAGKCGQAVNNCGSPVNCGSCVCSPACPACERCNAGTGRCEPHPDFLGQTCAAAGQVCQTDGRCVCERESCAPGQRCNGLACVCDGTSCPTGCCVGTTCRINDNDACGTGGGACTTCTSCQVCNGAGQCEADLGQNRTSCRLAGGGTGVCCNGTCCAGCCDANDNCGACLAFVTSTSYTGNLGGLAGADAKCQARAAAGSLPGTYRAWLSNGTHSPTTRFRCRGAGCSAQGYKRVDGVVIANDWADLTTCEPSNGPCLDAPINVTELNQSLSTSVWTNTTTSGTVRSAATTDHCQNWVNATGAAGGNPGGAGFNDSSWTARIVLSCSAASALYCFQQS